VSGGLADLALLGTVLVVVAGLGVALAALGSGRSVLARRAARAVAALVALYAAVLLGFSLASRERTIAPGGEKSVAGFDPHLHFRVEGPLGRARDGALTVTVLLRSDALRAVQDPRSLSVALVDARGRRWPVLGPGTPAPGAPAGRIAPFPRTLAPGESRAVPLRFRPEPGAPGLRLLIVESAFPCAVTIGHEASPLHRKAYFALPALAHSPE
jgi:hypothetical protein